MLDTFCFLTVIVWIIDVRLRSLCVSQYRTNSVPVMKRPRTTESSSVTRRALIYNLQDDGGSSENGSEGRNFQLDLTPPPDVVMRITPGTSEGMNVLGIVIFSATMGKKTHTNTHYHHVIPVV